MPLPYELHLALRYLRFHRGRTFLSVITVISVAGVAVGTAALVMGLASATGFQEDLRERILRGSAHLTVMAVGAKRFELDSESLDRIAEVPGIRGVGPVIFSPGMLTNEEVASPAYVELHGIDPGRHEKVVFPEEGEVLAALQGAGKSGRPGIVLGSELAASVGALEGDLIRIMVPRVTLTPFTPIPRSKVFEVVGFFSTDSYLQDARRAYVDLESAQSLLGAKGLASWIELRLDDLRELETMKEKLESSLGSTWLVVDMIEENRDFLRALNTEKALAFFVIGLIVVVAAFNIVSTLTLMVTDKIKDVGTLTALGARPVNIATVFMLQGVVIGVVGSALGITLGTVASTLLDRYQLWRLNPEVYYLSYVPFTPRISDIVFAGALAFVVSFLATLYPAWKAASHDPVEAIRYE